MRKVTRARPLEFLQPRERVRVLGDAVGLWRIDLDHVAPCGFEVAEAHQVFDVLRREQVLAGRERVRIGLRDFGKGRKIQRVARLLEPA